MKQVTPNWYATLFRCLGAHTKRNCTAVVSQDLSVAVFAIEKHLDRPDLETSEGGAGGETPIPGPVVCTPLVQFDFR